MRGYNYRFAFYQIDGQEGDAFVMIIDLASVGRNSKRIELEFEPSDIDLDEGARLTTNVAFAGDISRHGTRTHVRGRIEAGVETDCVRCLELVGKAIDVQFEDIFVDAADEPTDDEIELGESELDESLIASNEIDMVEVVREQLILATTETVFCKEDCKGLCPKCGANRNLIDCKCEENEIDPRWAALKSLN